MRDADGGLWRLRAECRPENRHDPELWWPRATSGSEVAGQQRRVAAIARADQIARARAICMRCTVSDPCLAYAERHGIKEGIWGGLTEEERDQHQPKE